MMHPVFVQAICYGVFGVFCFAGVGFLLRGFFWKYIKVRTSFGKLLIVKIRTPLRDYFEIGWMQDSFLVYKYQKVTYRLTIDQKNKPFYRCMAVTWIDVNEENHSVCNPDYSTVPGWDLQKHDSVVTRALVKPSIQSNNEKIMLLCAVLLVLGIVVLVFLSIKTGKTLNIVLEQIASMKGIVMGGTVKI